MSSSSVPVPQRSAGDLPEGEALLRNVADRRKRGRIWQAVLFSSLLIGVLCLATLLFDVTNSSFGLVAVQYKVDPATLADGRPLEDLSQEELTQIFRDNVSAGLYRRYEREKPFAERSEDELLQLVNERVVDVQVVRSYELLPSLFNRAAIEQSIREDFPNADIEFRSWVTNDFLTTPMSSSPAVAGIRTALLGSLYMILITVLIAVPVGVCAAIYLEEYAVGKTAFAQTLNRVIETNINNLAGVPSIIYGMLGLAVFVRALEGFTSGQWLGISDSNGRTIISAALTMALLILPLIIINAREAMRAVPSSLRQASYGLGATKWQTVWNIVLPNSMAGILTGTILGVSRAIGETAPLVVVGASTYIVTDPNGPFSKFTTLPIQIYNWTSQPNEQFRNIAAAAIIVLLVLLLSLNALAILLRNRFRRSY